MGAGIAGLSTARALSDHFDEVMLLERDQLSEGPEYRPGVPQARQYHTLLYAGLQQMETWFPGLEEELIAAGAIPYDPIQDIQMRLRNRWYPRFASGWNLLSCSRLLLESGIRQRLHQTRGIHFMEGVHVIGLQSDKTKRRLTGVRIGERRSGSKHGGEVPALTADLVVDALGRSSQTPEWLVEMGYLAPQETEVNSFLGYVTRRYRLKPDTPMLLIGANPPNEPYAGLILPEEDDTMVALMAGYNKHYPPTDPQEFQAAAAWLGPEFQAALEGAEPISQPMGYRGTSSRWRHYEQLNSWPERFVVLGDAFCSFNPIYGQGMSVAAMSAVALAEQVRRSHGDLDGVARATLRDISRITEGIWLLATSADLEWPGTEGGNMSNGPMARFARWYIGQMLGAMEFDRKVRLGFFAVNQLIRPGKALFAPQIFLRVMRQTLLRKLR